VFGLIPKDQSFFDLFERSALNVHKGAQKLVELMGRFKDLPAMAQEIRDIEHEGDKLTHEVIERVNRSFITPLDREDIHILVGRLDDVIDLINSAVNRMALYKLAEATEDARALAVCLEKAASMLKEAMPRLRKLSHKKEVEILLKCCVDINTFENEGDRIHQHGLASLFENGHDPIFVIKWKDVYQDLETSIDRCEDVANVIEAIVLKNA
jgi:hypothetical protein